MAGDGTNGQPRSVYESETVQIGALGAERRIIQGVTFDNCRIVGPAILYIHPNWNPTLEEVTFDIPDNDWETILWEVSPDISAVVGAIPVPGCVFRKCRFSDIGIASVRSLLDRLRAS